MAWAVARCALAEKDVAEKDAAEKATVETTAVKEVVEVAKRQRRRPLAVDQLEHAAKARRVRELSKSATGVSTEVHA